MYWLIPFIAIPILLCWVETRFTKTFYCEVTETSWLIRWGFAKHFINVFILYWLLAGFLSALYIYTDLGNYKQLFIASGFVILIMGLLYIREKWAKPIYASFDKKTSVLTHDDWYVYLHEIDRFEYDVTSDVDVGDSVCLCAVLKTGTRVYFSTGDLTMTSGKVDTYREIRDKLTEFTGLECYHRSK